MDHTEVAAALQALAPLELAEQWDRVGLLLEPAARVAVRRILVALDLTEPVLEEALACRAEMVVAYHPPLFEPLAALRWGNPRERVLLRAAAAGLALYSPHTALDAARGGMADWLAEGLGPGAVRALRPHSPARGSKVVVFVPRSHAARLREALAELGAGRIGNYSQCSFSLEGTGTFLGGEGSRPAVGRSGRLEALTEVRLEVVCPEALLPLLGPAIRAAHPYEEPAWEVYPLAAPPDPALGPGRLVELERPAALPVLARRLARHLGVRSVEALPAPSREARAPVCRVALCPGAGGSLLREAAGGAEAWLAGELGYHDLLAAHARGVGVLLAGHAASEWGFLPILARRLSDRLGRGVRVAVSRLRPPGVDPRGAGRRGLAGG